MQHRAYFRLTCLIDDYHRSPAEPSFLCHEDPSLPLASLHDCFFGDSAVQMNDLRDNRQDDRTDDKLWHDGNAGYCRYPSPGSLSPDTLPWQAGGESTRQLVA